MCLNNTAAPCLPVCPPCPCSVFMFLSLKCTTLQTVTLYFLQTKKPRGAKAKDAINCKSTCGSLRSCASNCWASLKLHVILKIKKQKRLTFFFYNWHYSE